MDGEIPASLIGLLLVMASFLAAIVGFAFSAIGGVALALAGVPAERAITLLLVCSIASQSLGVYLLRRDVCLRRVLPFAAGSVIGVPFGVATLSVLSSSSMKVALGFLVLCYAASLLYNGRRTVRTESTPIAMLCGALGGFTGGIAALPSLPVTVWCRQLGWSKEAQRAVYQPFILFAQVVALMWQRRVAPESLDLEALTFVPAALVATYCGFVVFRRLSDDRFRVVLAWLLAVCGLVLGAHGAGIF